jgi:hypothetical protein
MRLRCILRDVTFEPERKLHVLQLSVEEKIPLEADAEAWDCEIERDAASGKLEKLFAISLADHRAGKSREI